MPQFWDCGQGDTPEQGHRKYGERERRQAKNLESRAYRLMFWAMGSSLGLNNRDRYCETAEDSREGSLVWSASNHTQIILVRITSNSINASLVLSHMVSAVAVTGPRRPQ